MREIQSLYHRQRKFQICAWVIAILCALTVAAAFTDVPIFSGNWPLAFVSIFLAVSSLVCSAVFASRAKKMNRLLSGESLLARWHLDEKMLAEYVRFNHETAIAKSKAIMTLLTVLFTVITLPFLFFLEADERIGFLFLMGSILLVVFLASRFFPWYYRKKNLAGDGIVLVGAKYAYINGYLHNWDFPLSGLDSVKSIATPFRGLQLCYYYTDRTFRNTHKLLIPISVNLDLDKLIDEIRMQS